MRGLNRLYYIKIEIENLKEEIKNLPTISSTDLSGMPHGTNVNNPIEKYLLKKEALIEKLNIFGILRLMVMRCLKSASRKTGCAVSEIISSVSQVILSAYRVVVELHVL